MPDEVPVIGLKGERVLNRAETRAYDSGQQGAGGRSMVINSPIHVHTTDADSFRRSGSQIAAAQQTHLDRAARNF